MQILRSAFLTGLLVLSIGSLRAQSEEDLAIIKKVQDAVANAPSSRVTSIVTDRSSGAEVEKIVVEREQPDKVHFITTDNGAAGTEMVSDGKRNLMRHGPNEPWKSLPVNMSAMMNASLSNLAQDTFREEHGHLKLLGSDQVNGTAAKVYELTTDDNSSKIWLATDTSRPLKAERDYKGPGPIPRMKDGAGRKLDLNALRDQLKAAKTERQLHSVTTFDYDPSIKVTLPN